MLALAPQYDSDLANFRSHDSKRAPASVDQKRVSSRSATSAVSFSAPVMPAVAALHAASATKHVSYARLRCEEGVPSREDTYPPKVWSLNAPYRLATPCM